jgi:hypothetical protein
VGIFQQQQQQQQQREQQFTTEDTENAEDGFGTHPEPKP